jgi:hypothetical protein
MKRTVRIAFTDFWHPNTEEAVRRQNPIYQLLSEHFDLRFSDRPDFLIYSCFGNRHLKFDCTRIFYTGENRRPDFTACDYAFSFDYPLTSRNYRLPLYRLWDRYAELRDRPRMAFDLSRRGFCNFLYSNRSARERIRFFKLLSQYRKVDSGGRVLNNLGIRIDDKLEFLSRYKFTIAFENSSHTGYTTEKLFEALVAGTVPIYWGNPLAHRDFNPAAFINCHDYGSFEEVVERVRELDQDDDALRKCLAEPIYAGGVENPFVREENIIARFADIFATTCGSGVAGRADPVKYYVHPGTLLDSLRRVYWRLR